jgi:neuroligin
MKPKVREHYHSHRLSFWLHLIPRLHQPGEEDIYLRHHLLQDHENPSSYDGIVRQIAFKFLQPLPTAAQPKNMNLTKLTKLNYKVMPTTNVYPLTTHLSVENDMLSMITSNKTIATAIVMNENNYKTALTITIVIGCSLLFLNVLIFVVVYYQLNKTKRKRRKHIHQHIHEVIMLG